MGEAASARDSDDMSWGEVAQLGLRYGKIPLALLAVEALKNQLLQRAHHCPGHLIVHRVLAAP